MGATEDFLGDEAPQSKPQGGLVKHGEKSGQKGRREFCPVEEM